MQDTRWMQSTVPLPVRTIPGPWEDLPSLVSRASANMGYRNPVWVLRPEDIPHIIRTNSLLMLRNAKDYRLLELLLNIGEEAVYKLTFHRFASRLQAPEIPHSDALDEVLHPFITYTTQVSFFHSYNSTKVCPQCLDEEERFGRLYWYISYVLSCPRHGIGLVDQCPICHSSIPALRPLLSVCPECQKGDYRVEPTKVLPEDPFLSAGHALILSRLGIENLEWEWTSSVLSGSPLLELLPWQYFQLLHAFRYILDELSPDSPFLRANAEQRTMLRLLSNTRSLSHPERAVLIATFHFIFASWPDNFFALLETLPYQRRELPERKTSRTTGLFRDFGRLYKTWLYHRLKDPAYSFLNEAFTDYLGKRYTGGYLHDGFLPYRGRQGELWQEQAYMPKRHVIKTLGITDRTLEELIEQGHLRVHKKVMGKKGKKTLTLIERSSVEEMRAEWEKFVTIESVAKEFLGIRSAALYTLMDADLLVPERGPKIDGYSQYLYKKADVEQFVNALLQCAVKVQQPFTEGSYLSLTRHWLGGRLTLATTITEILHEHLLPIDLDNGRPLFQRLFLTRTEMNRFREKRKRWREEELEWFTLPEAAAHLGVFEGILKHWMQCGLISGERKELDTIWRRPCLMFTKESLEEFRKTYALTEDVATLFGVTPATIDHYVSKGIIHQVVGRRTHQGGSRMLFLREEVESLAPPGSLSIREAMTLLGVSKNQIYSLIHTRHLPCIHQPSGQRTPIRFLRSDLETYWRCQVELYQQLLAKLSLERVDCEGPWLLRRDVAALMGVTVATVRNWIHRELLPAKKKTSGAVSVYYIRQEDLAKFVQKLLEKAELVMMRLRMPDQDA